MTNCKTRVECGKSMIRGLPNMARCRNEAKFGDFCRVHAQQAGIEVPAVPQKQTYIVSVSYVDGYTEELWQQAASERGARSGITRYMRERELVPHGTGKVVSVRLAYPAKVS